MRIALIQPHPIPGDIDANLRDHATWIVRAAEAGAQVVVFPELSLTGYEPALASELAMAADDHRFDPLQVLVDRHHLLLAFGAPLRTDGPPHIALVLCRPHAPRQVCLKHHLHEDERPFFRPGPPICTVLPGPPAIGLAICYELSVPAHAQASRDAGAELYLASVAKTARGVAAAHERLARIAREHHMPTLMVNCVGPCEGERAAGGSAVWDARGERVASLGGEEPGMLMYDAAAEPG